METTAPTKTAAALRAAVPPPIKTDVKTPLPDANTPTADANTPTADANTPTSSGPFIWSPEVESKRLTIKPYFHPDIIEFRKVLEQLRWTVEDVNLADDAKDWQKKLSPGDRLAVGYALGLFAVFDKVVLENLPGMVDAIGCLEGRRVYEAQADQEAVHEEAYMLQIEAVTADEKEREMLRNSAVTRPGVKKLVEWAQQHLAVDDVPYRLAVFAVIEGVIFSAFFSILQWLRERNLLPGVVTLNELIVRDEGRHTMFTCYLIRNCLRVPLKRGVIVDVLKSGVATVSAMIDEAIPKPLIGLSASQVKQYVQFQGDLVLNLAGYAPHYKATNPFPFMEKLALNAVAKVNFFERRVTQYKGASAGDAVYQMLDTPL